MNPLRRALEARLDQQLGPKSMLKVRLNPSGRPNPNAPTAHVAVRSAGQGPDLYLLHGIGASQAIYRKIAPLLHVRFKVTCIDWIGFGESDKPIESEWYKLDSQAEVLRQVVQLTRRDNRIQIAASSMGGAISSWAIASREVHPSEATLSSVRLILLSPALRPEKVPVWAIWTTRLLGSLVMSFLLALLMRLTPFGRWFIKRACQLVVNQSQLVSDDFVDLYSRPYLLGSLREAVLSIRAFFLCFRVLSDRRLKDILSKLKAETTALAATNDPLVTLNDMKKIEAELAAPSRNHIRFKELKSLGHHAMEEDPTQIASLISD